MPDITTADDNVHERMRELLPDEDSIIVFVAQTTLKNYPKWTKQDVSQWVDGSADFPKKFIEALSRTLHVNARWIRTGTGERNHRPVGVRPGNGPKWRGRSDASDDPRKGASLESLMMIDIIAVLGTAQRLAFFLPLVTESIFKGNEAEMRKRYALLLKATIGCLNIAIDRITDGDAEMRDLVHLTTERAIADGAPLPDQSQPA